MEVTRHVVKCILVFDVRSYQTVLGTICGALYRFLEVDPLCTDFAYTVPVVREQQSPNATIEPSVYMYPKILNFIPIRKQLDFDLRLKFMTHKTKHYMTLSDTFQTLLKARFVPAARSRSAEPDPLVLK